MEISGGTEDALCTIRVSEGARNDDHVRTTLIVFGDDRSAELYIKMTRTEAYLLASALMEQWRK